MARSKEQGRKKKGTTEGNGGGGNVLNRKRNRAEMEAAAAAAASSANSAPGTNTNAVPGTANNGSKNGGGNNNGGGSKNNNNNNNNNGGGPALDESSTSKRSKNNNGKTPPFPNRSKPATFRGAASANTNVVNAGGNGRSKSNGGGAGAGKFHNNNDPVPGTNNGNGGGNFHNNSAVGGPSLTHNDSTNQKGSFNNHTMTMPEEINLHAFLRDCLAQRNTPLNGNRAGPNLNQHQQPPPPPLPTFQHISGRTQQWPAILHPGSVALVLVALLPPDSNLALLQDCLVRHCRTVGIPWLELSEQSRTHTHTHDDPAKSKSSSSGSSDSNNNRHRFLWDCITDKGTAACLLLPRQTTNLRVLLEPRRSQALTAGEPPPLNDHGLDRFYANMGGWVRALCNAPEREQVYQLVLDYMVEQRPSAGHLSVEQQLQQVLQQVEARTTRLVLVSAQVWQSSNSTKLASVTLMQQCLSRQVPIFLVYDTHFCNNQRFPAVFSLGSNIHSVRKRQLQSVQELCRTMHARPLWTMLESSSASALGVGMGLGSGGVGGPSAPTAGSIPTVARPMGGVATAASFTNSSSSRPSNFVPPPPPLPALPPVLQSSRPVLGRTPLPPLPTPTINSSTRQGELSAVPSREPEMAAGTRSVEDLAPGLSSEHNTIKNDLVCRPLAAPLPPPPPPPEGARRVAVPESESSPADLILSPGVVSVQEQDRIHKMLTDHQFKIIMPPYRLVSSLSFVTEEWARWLHPDRIGFVLFVPDTCKNRSATTIFTTCLILYCQKVGIPCLRLRKEEGVNHASRMITNNDVALCFDRSLVNLKDLLDPERRPDLLISTMARRAPSILSTDLTWANFVCKWEERNRLILFFKCNKGNSHISVAAQIARVSQMVDEKRTSLVIISARIWQVQVKVTIALIKRCKVQQVPVLLIPSDNLGDQNNIIYGIVGVAQGENGKEELLQSRMALSKKMMARAVPMRLSQVLQSRRDPFGTLSEHNLVWDLLERNGPTAFSSDDRAGTDGSQDGPHSTSAIVLGVHNVKSAIDQKKALLIFVSLNHETTVGTDLSSCLKLWWEAKKPLLFLRMARRNVAFNGDKAVAFCLTSVRPGDEGKLRSLLALAEVKRKEFSIDTVVLGDSKEGGASVCIPEVVEASHGSTGFVGQSPSPLERQIVLPSPEESSLQGKSTAAPCSNSSQVVSDYVTPPTTTGEKATYIRRPDLPNGRASAQSNVKENTTLQQHVQQTSNRSDRSNDHAEDLIMSPDEVSMEEEVRICELLTNHRDRAIPSEHHWVTPTKFKVSGWPRWLTHDRVALVVLMCRGKQDLDPELLICVSDYCRRVGIPCLRLRPVESEHSKAVRGFFGTKSGLMFHPNVLGLKSVLDPERRPDILSASIAARPLSPLMTNSQWSYSLCGFKDRRDLDNILLPLGQYRINHELTNVAEEIAHATKQVEDKKTRLVAISASAWLQRFEETLSLMRNCKRHQVPVFLIHDKQLSDPPRFHAILCLQNRNYDNIHYKGLRNLQLKSRTMLMGLEVASSSGVKEYAGRPVAVRLESTQGGLGPAETATFPEEGLVELSFNDAYMRNDLNDAPPTVLSPNETLNTAAESIQSTVTRKRQGDDQGSVNSNDAGSIPVSQSEESPQQNRLKGNGKEAPPVCKMCTVQEETNIYSLLQDYVVRAGTFHRQQSIVRIGVNTEMWPQLLHPDRTGLVLVARFKRLLLSDCIVEYCRRVAIPCLVLREAIDGNNIALRKLVTENEMTCLGIGRELFALKNVVELKTLPWMLATQMRSKTIPKYTANMGWTKLLCNERQREQVCSLLGKYVSVQGHERFPSVEEQIAHLLCVFDKLSNSQARKRLVVITAEAWLHYLPETSLLIEKCKNLCTAVFLIHDYPHFIGKRGNSCILVNEISQKGKRDLQMLHHLGLEMMARPNHPSIAEARSTAVRRWKDGLCDPSESEAVLQLLEECQFPANSAENPSIDGSLERATSASVILRGARTVTSCVRQKRAILVFVALDSEGAFETEAVFALVELCRELNTPLLFVQETVCVNEALHVDHREPIVFCLTSVRAEDVDVLQGLRELAGIKRNKVFDDLLQLENAESYAKAALSEPTNSSGYGVGLAAKTKENAVVEDVTKVLSVETSSHQDIDEIANALHHGVGLVGKEKVKENTVAEDVTKVLSIQTSAHQDIDEITITDLSRCQIPLKASATGVSAPTNKELFLLEEEVSLLEASQETLRARIDELKANDLAQDQDSRARLGESIANLQSRSEQLHTAQIRQLELEQELIRSIARSRTQLGRLLGRGSVPSADGTSGLSVREADARVTDGASYSSATKATEELVADQPAREDTEMKLSLGENSQPLPNHVDAKKDMKQTQLELGARSSSPALEYVPNTEFKSCAIYKIPEHDRFSLFWTSRGMRDRKMTPFLPIVNSKELLKYAMDVSVRDILSLDGRDSSARHRREVLWNTSLDVRPMVFSEEREGKIGQDENSPPHHNHVEDRLEADRDLFRGSAFERDKLISGESEGGRPAIDPNVPLCPYDLAGICLDPYCAYQHLGNRPLGNVLPRELVPLPPLSLSASTAISTPMMTGDVRADANAEPLNKKRRMDAKRATTVACEGPATAGDASLVPRDRDDTMSSNADFIFVGEISEREEDTSDEESDGEEKVEPASAGKKIAAMWWLLEKEMTSLHLPPSALSFSAFLESLGYRFSKSLTEVRLSAEVPRTEEAACSMVGMTVDCIGLAIHAGRYDISAAFKSMVGQLVDTVKDSTFKRIIGKGMDIMKNEENRAFSFTAVTQHPFLVAFETQLAVALVSVFLEQFRFFLCGRTDSDHVSLDSCSPWHAPLNAFESAFSPDKKDLGLSGSSLIGIRSNFFRHDYSQVKAEEWESESSRAHRSVVHWLLEDVCRGASLKKVASEASSIRCLIDDILDPTWLAAKEMLRANLVSEDQPTSVYLRAVLTIGYVVLGAVEKAARLIPCDQFIADVKTELAELYSTIDKILLALRRLVRQLPWMDLLISPLFAANVSLACTIQLYEKSQHRLESLLCGDVGSTSRHPPSLTVPLASFAELLWSQLVQLRSALPIGSRTGMHETSWELSVDVAANHELLASCISEKEVHLHHLCFDNDWNIVAALNTGPIDGRKELRGYCLAMLKALMTGSTRTDLVFDFQSRPIRLIGMHGIPSPVRSAFPRSLLLAGTTLGTLRLSGCGLESLPDHFGSYFPNLSNLELADNKLEKMPESIVLLRNLTFLSIGNNQIGALPCPFALEKLVTFSAPNNLLNEVPTSLKDCKDLEVLDLSGNPLRPEFWSLVLQLKKLRHLSPQPATRSS